jgi:type VI secretion system protein ImpG
LSFNKYYQDELSFLREMGREFAEAHPEGAHFLGERGSDPDVERLLEGFAFLTGRIRQKLDDELPEATHALMSLLLPHYLRPIPPMSVVEFQPLRGMVEGVHRLPRGTGVASVPVDGTSCHFRTAYDVDLYPFTVESVSFHTPVGGRPELRVRFSMESRHSLARLELPRLRLFLHGESAEDLYLWLSRHLESVRIRPGDEDGPERDVFLAPASVRPAGFDRDDALLPWPRASFDGYRLLQEYFSFPEKFLFVDLVGLDSLRERLDTHAFEVGFIFSGRAGDPPRVADESVRLYCTPAVNLVEMESEPLQVDHARAEYRIRPPGANADHFEIYSVDRASGWTRGTVEELEYPPFYSFDHGKPGANVAAASYHAQMRSAVAGEGADVYVSFVSADQSATVPATETVVFRLTCTNRRLAEKLRSGDLHVATESSPTVARFRNITRVTPGVRAPLHGDLHWRLISHLALNRLSLSSVPVFQETLQLYNFQSLDSPQAGKANQLRIEGIVGIESRAETLLMKGIPVRGVATLLEIKESHFASDGDLFLFATVLNEFLSLGVSLNSFSQLRVRGAEKGETYEWPALIGRQAIL